MPVSRVPLFGGGGSGGGGGGSLRERSKELLKEPGVMMKRRDTETPAQQITTTIIIIIWSTIQEQAKEISISVACCRGQFIDAYCLLQWIRKMGARWTYCPNPLRQSQSLPPRHLVP